MGLAGFHAAADPAAFPEAGPPWQLQKLYYMMFSRRRMAAMAEKFLELGMDVPWMRTPRTAPASSSPRRKTR